VDDAPHENNFIDFAKNQAKQLTIKMEVFISQASKD